MKHVPFLDCVESETYMFSQDPEIEKYCRALWDEEADVDGPFNLLPVEGQPLTKDEIDAEDEHIYMLENDPVYRRECDECVEDF